MEFSEAERRTAISYLCTSTPKWGHDPDPEVARFLRWMLQHQLNDPHFRISQEKIYNDFLCSPESSANSRLREGHAGGELNPGRADRTAISNQVSGFLTKVKSHIDRCYRDHAPTSPPFVHIAIGKITLQFLPNQKTHSNANRIPKRRSRPEDNAAWRFWKSLLHPVRGEKCTLVYSNETPSLPESIKNTLNSRYSGFGVAPAAFLVGQCIAHQKVSFGTMPSTIISGTMVHGDEADLLAWRAIVFLGNTRANTALDEFLKRQTWCAMQHFHFVCLEKSVAIYKGKPGKAVGEPWVSSLEKEFALAFYFKSKGQVVVGLAGNQTVGTWGAAKMLCEPSRVIDLMSELKFVDGEAVPAFEVVLEITIKRENPIEVKIVDKYIHSE